MKGLADQDLSQMLKAFSAWIPFDVDDADVEKAGDTDAKLGLTKGIASSELKDYDGEVVEQDGLDFTDCKWVTLEHPLGVINIIGEPVSFKQATKGGVKVTEASAHLYLTDPLGRATFNKSVALKKAREAGAKNSLGWSIEGAATDRIPGRIRKARITSLAVSSMPKNKLALFDPIAASLMSGIGGGIPGLPIMFYRAEAGYPAQGVAGSSPFNTTVPQSIQGVRSALSGVQGFDDLDVATAQLLKRLPHVTWTQGRAAIEAIRDRLGRGEA